MSDRSRHSTGVSPNVYQQLRQRNERRMKLARQADARRLSQVERVLELARRPRFRAPGK
jgi:hypothetical protein